MVSYHPNRLKLIPGTRYVDLIGPYNFPHKKKNLLKLWCLTRIDTTTGWFDREQIPNKRLDKLQILPRKLRLLVTHYHDQTQFAVEVGNE